MPEWLFELFNPWTTPAALVVRRALDDAGIAWVEGLLRTLSTEDKVRQLFNQIGKARHMFGGNGMANANGRPSPAFFGGGAPVAGTPRPPQAQESAPLPFIRPSAFTP